MIFHILERASWDSAQAAGTYTGDTLSSEGFIHCSELRQVEKVANARFRGRANLVLLCIDPVRLHAELKYEDGGAGELFPHVYGPLNLDAVEHVVEFPCSESGFFRLPPELSAKRRTLREALNRPIIAVPLTLLILCGLWLLLRGINLGAFGQGDFIQYWAGAKLFFSGGNPYDLGQMAQIEAPVNLESIVILTWNPPLLFPTVAPIVLLDFHPAVALWIILSSIAFVASFAILLRCDEVALHGREAAAQRILFLLSFYPVAMVLVRGQISNILLLSFAVFIALFVRTDGRGRSAFIAGLALTLTMLKPHLLYLVYIWLFVRGWRLKTWLPLLGLVSGTLALALLTFLLRSDIFTLFVTAISTPPIYWKTPTLGTWLQQFTDVHETWVRLLPTYVVACAAVVILARSRFVVAAKGIEALMVLTPLSLLTSPYGWQFDHVLLLPTAIWCIARAEYKTSRAAWLLVLANFAIFFAEPQSGMHYFVWYPAVFFVVAYSLSSLGEKPSTKQSGL